jgi:hypothetical protein
LKKAIIAQLPILPQVFNLTIIIVPLTILTIMNSITRTILNLPNIHLPIRFYSILIVFMIGISSLFLIGCQPEVGVPTVAVAAATIVSEEVDTEMVAESTPALIPPTWTPQTNGGENKAVVAATPVSTSTPRPTKTPFATLLPTLTLTSSPTPVVTSLPATQPPEPPVNDPVPTSIPSNPILGGNLLPNSSFEEGHYNMWGIPELQLPVGWVFEWDESRTGFGDEEWDVYIRPEIRVMSKDFLPVSEHSLYIYDGEHTIKAFKQDGAISFKLFRDVVLQPGTYVLEINVYPDLYMDFQEGRKIWADDPLTGQFRFIAPEATGWMGTVYGRKNTFTHTFTVETTESIPIGAAMRGNHAIMNDGWFFDDWSLKRIEN